MGQKPAPTLDLAADSKSRAARRPGSSPGSGTTGHAATETVARFRILFRISFRNRHLCAMTAPGKESDEPSEQIAGLVARLHQR
jgi:hypothetical protein